MVIMCFILLITVGIIVTVLFCITKAAEMFVESVLEKLKDWFISTPVYIRFQALDKITKIIVGVTLAIAVSASVAAVSMFGDDKVENFITNVKQTLTVHKSNETSDDKEKDDKKSIPYAEKLADVYIDTQKTKNQITQSALEGKITPGQAVELIKALDEKSITEEQFSEIIQMVKDTSK